MVSSSLDKSIKKALVKDTSMSASSASGMDGGNNANSSSSSGAIGDVSLPPDEKLEILFPKCRPRMEYQNSITSPLDIPPSSELISITSPSSSLLHSTVLTTTATTSTLVPSPYNKNNNNNLNTQQASNILNMNNSKQQMKLQSQPLSPDHKKQQHQFTKLSTNSSAMSNNNKHELNDNYVETNPFRIGSNNRYFYAQQNDSLFNNNSASSASSNNAMMHHYHYQTSSVYHSNYQQDRNYFLEPDEIEHNPYAMDVPSSVVSTSSINTIPSSILKTTPPDTPPALQPCTTPVDSSPLGSSRNLWDLSPIKIKSSTPTRIKTQSPTPHYTRPHRGSYKKLLASPLPIEEDLETGHYYYNNKKQYYQAPQTDSDSNEPATFNDVHEVEKFKPKAHFNNKMKQSESSDVIYAEVKKRDERKIVKSKSGSGIMEYDGSPRRFGMASNDDFDYYSQSNYQYNSTFNSPPPLQSIGVNGNYSSPSPPRPGFPQRVLSYDQPAQLIPKSYSFDDQQILASTFLAQQQQNVTTTSTLIPTTFINNNSAYELQSSPPLPQTPIEEEPEIIVDAMPNESKEEYEEKNINEVVVEEEHQQHISNLAVRAPETPIKEYEKPQSEVMIASALTSAVESNAFDITSPTENLPTTTFDYLYEFSETRKVLEEFFKCPDDKIKEFEKFSDFNESDDSLDIQYNYHREQIEKEMENLYSDSINPQEQQQVTSSSPILNDSQLLDEDIDDDNRDDRVDDKEEEAYVKAKQNGFVVAKELKETNNKPFDYYLDSASRSSMENVDQENELDNGSTTRINKRRLSKTNSINSNGNSNPINSSYQRRQSQNFNYSPDTTDYDSESSMRFIVSDYSNAPKSIQTAKNVSSASAAAAMVDMSGGPINSSNSNSYAKYCTSMPVLEDGLSSGHASDNENNNPVPSSNDFYNRRNGSTASSSTISTIQKQYQQENLVQTHANNNIFYTTNNNNNNNNSILLNNGDLEQATAKVRATQSPLSYHHPYYAMRYDMTSSNNAVNTANIKEPPLSSSLRYDTVNSVGSKELTTSRYDNNTKEHTRESLLLNPTHNSLLNNNKIFKNRDPELESLYTINTIQLSSPPPPAPVAHRQLLNDAQFNSQILPSTHQLQQKQETDIQAALKDIRTSLQRSKMMNANNPSTPIFNNASNITNNNGNFYDRTPVIPEKVESPALSLSPVWIPRSRDKLAHSPIPPNETGLLLSKHNKNSDDEEEEEIDTDLETDRLLGHQLLDDGFYDDKGWNNGNKQLRPLLNSNLTSKISPKVIQQQNLSIAKSNSSSLIRHGLNTLLPTSSSSDCCVNNGNSPVSLKTSPSLNSSNLMNLIHTKIAVSPDRRFEVDPSPRKLEDLPEQLEEISSQQQLKNNNVPETNDLCNLDGELVDSPGGSSSDKSTNNNVKDTTSIGGDKKKKNKNKEDIHTTVLIEGVLFRARYLGSTQLVCEGQPTKSTRMMQAEEAVSRIKAPDGESQPSTEVDLFISTEKIMVLNTDLKEIMMDHALRTISYIADIGDLVVLMARRRFVPQDHEANSDSGTGTGGSGNVSGGSGGPTPPTSGKINRTPKMICHVFESEEAQFIAQSIGQAFQVAYMEFLKANGIEDHSFMKEMDYQEVLNSQEIFGDELEIFAKKELQKEVVVPKTKGEILGVVIVESGWGSMLPTVVIANLASNGAAARCGQLNIGDQIIAINGLSLVGLPLSQCQQYIKNTKNQTVVKFTVVPCAPVVEVKIKRPNTKYQLGFSVQNGVICSLLRGGIAERGGVRVGHRIIEINNQSVVAVPHEKIVNLLATSVGEIHMKTMPTSMFRLLTGQENPIYI